MQKVFNLILSYNTLFSLLLKAKLIGKVLQGVKTAVSLQRKTKER